MLSKTIFPNKVILLNAFIIFFLILSFLVPSPKSFANTPSNETNNLATTSCGKAIELDGSNDWINIPDLSLANDFTIEGWFKLAPGIDFKDPLFGQEGYGPDIHFTAGKVRLYAYGIRVTANTPLIADTWGHIAITRSGSTLTVYVNGVKDATGNWNGSFSVKAIGRGNRGFVDGMLDEIRIWDIARTEAEIGNSFDTDVDANTAGLIGYWNFNETDQLVTDASSSANHGSLGVSVEVGADDPVRLDSNAPLTESCDDGNTGGNTNTAPTANNDTVGPVTAGDAIEFSVTGNDEDIDDNLDPTSVTITTPPSFGDAIVTATGSISYTHTGTTATTDTLSYTVADTAGATSEPASVIITVTEQTVVNTAPVANDDTVGPVQAGGTITFTVTDNDQDSESNLNPASVVIKGAGPGDGMAAVNPSGTISYTNMGSTATTDTLIYTVADTEGEISNEATVSITVSDPDNPPANENPVAQADTATVESGQAVAINVLANDGDTDGTLDKTSLIIVNQPISGTVAIETVSGEITYTHDGSATTSDSFTYTVADNDSAVSNEVTVSITITSSAASCGKAIELDGSNDWVNIPDLTLANDFTIEGWVKLAPGIDNKDALFGQEGSGPDINFYQGKVHLYSYGDKVIANTALLADTWGHVAITRAGTDLTLYINGIEDATGTWNGSLSLKAIGRGNRGYFKGMLDEVRVWNIARTGTEISSSFDTDVNPNTAGLIGYWNFNETDQIVADASNAANHGSLGVSTEVGADDPVRLDSNAPLTESCDDGNTGGNTNTAPTANNDTVGPVQAGGTITFTVTGNDEDIDDNLDPASVTIVTHPGVGNVTVDTNTGAISYINTGTTATTDTLIYTVADTEGEISNEATVSITVTDPDNPPANENPVAQADTATVESGQAVAINVLANDSDNDGTLNKTSLIIVNQPVSGTVAIDSVSGEITYTHDGSATTSDSFSYIVADDQGDESNEATVSITIINSAANCGKAIDLDGINDWINIPDLILPNDFTIEGWVKLAAGIDNKDALFGQEGAGPDINFYQGKVHLYANGDKVIANTALLADNWGHVAITRSGTDLRLYINGTEDATGSWNGTLILKAIGRGNKGFLKGMLDEVRVWNIARTAAEIGSSFNMDVGLNSAGLIGYWSFNDADQIITDSSSSAYHGSLGVSTEFGADDPVRLDSTSPLTESCDAGNTGGNTNTAPIANDDTVGPVDAGGTLSFSVIGNDVDNDSNLDPTSLTIETDPGAGVATVNPDGTITYTKDGSAATTDSFSYTIADTDGAISNAATVSLTIIHPETPTLHGLFSDHAVLQRGVEVPVWGTAGVGATVNVTFSGQNKSTIADNNGQWMVKLDPLVANATGETLTVTSAGRTETRVDILVGEVWVASGQSNMAMAMFVADPANPPSSIPSPGQESFTPSVRVLQMKVSETSIQPTQELREGEKWKLSDREGINLYSAVAYYFARDINQALNVPVGIISGTAGGTSIKRWMPASAIQPDSCIESSPSVNYNYSIAPLLPYAIKGVIWYQGETNARDDRLSCYYDDLIALINGWRSEWANASNKTSYDFPFYFVQLPNFEANEHANAWINIRELMLKANLSTDLTEMAVTIDVGDSDDVHPLLKLPVAQRLARFARALDYGENIVYSGPLYQSIEISGNTAILSFDHKGSGLISSDGQPLKYFEIAGADGNYYPSQAVISGNKVHVSSTSVPSPVKVRYGWLTNPENPNFANQEGLMASPFRTDAAFWNNGNASNQPPVANDDIVGPVEVGGTLNFSVTGNDLDNEGNIDPTSVSIETTPGAGNVTVDFTTGEISYAHIGTTATTDTFSYTVADTVGATSDPATVSITVIEPTTVNTAPVAFDDIGGIVEAGESINFTVTDNDTDINNNLDPTSVSVVSLPSYGNAMVSGAGTISYTHTGTTATTEIDSFSYTVADSEGAISNEATVSVTVTEPTPTTSLQQTIKYYVSTAGDDNNPGTVGEPFRTLEKVRSAVAAYKQSSGLPDQGIAVVLREGIYHLGQTLSFGTADSGALGKPIVYQGEVGENVVVTGSQTLDPTQFNPVDSSSPIWNRLDDAAKSNVLQIDLGDQGISNFGSIQPRNVSANTKGALHLYFDNTPMTLARWPDKPIEDSPKNHGVSENGFIYISNALSNTAFTITSDRASRWAQAGDIWLHGFFKFNWADYHVPVINIDAAIKTFTVVQPGLGIASGQPFYAYNLLEEITEPGEWYLDRNSGVLYFWPPAEISSNHISVSMLDTNLVELNNASWITFKNIVFEGSRNGLIKMTGGSHNVIQNSTLRNSGSVAAIIDSTESGIEDSEIAYTGDGGVIVKGGNRVTLQRANNYIRNNRIHHFGQWVYGYKGGIKLEGAGHTVSNNTLYQSPHVAIQWEGNEHLIEKNEMHDVTRFSSDMGAMYSGRDWGWRGNVIRYNFIHDVYSWIQHGDFYVHGVYLDDTLSGTRVFGNIFYQIQGFGILSGGGRHNIMENNIFAHCGVPLFADNRGINAINFVPGSNWNLMERLEHAGIDYKAEPWVSKYPELAEIPRTFGTQDPTVRWLHPEGSVFKGNISFGVNTNPNVVNGIYDFDKSNPPAYSPISYFEDVSNNIDGQDPLFINEGALNLNLQPNSPAFSIPGFQAIPFNQIGVQ